MPETVPETQPSEVDTRACGIEIVFDGPPSHESGRFIEVEQDGKGISFGEWVHRDDGYWVLRLPPTYSPAQTAALKQAREMLTECRSALTVHSIVCAQDAANGMHSESNRREAERLDDLTARCLVVLATIDKALA